MQQNEGVFKAFIMHRAQRSDQLLQQEILVRAIGKVIPRVDCTAAVRPIRVLELKDLQGIGPGDVVIEQSEEPHHHRLQSVATRPT
eukprot:6857042-Prymnesium_polylepis.3